MASPVAVLLIGSLLAGSAGAPPAFDIRASMDAFVGDLAQEAAPCRGTEPYVLGREAAAVHASGHGWRWGSAFFPPASLAALASEAGELEGRALDPIPEPDRACFVEGYRDESRSSTRNSAARKALLGVGIGVAVVAVLLMVAVGSAFVAITNPDID